MEQHLPYDATMRNLRQSTDAVLEREVAKAFAASGKVVVVIDDDPTGAQTVHDVPILTCWGLSDIAAEILRGEKLFFILTNLRSLRPHAAEQVLGQVMHNLQLAFSAQQQAFVVLLRSDSTLRGHFPLDVNTVKQSLQCNPLVLHVPAFFEGDRYTINDIHYLRNGDELIPVGQSEFAKDKAFGYHSSNLKSWIEEKTKKAVLAQDVESYGSERCPDSITQTAAWLTGLNSGTQVVVNATTYLHLQHFALACWLSASAPFIIRSAASFVRALIGQPAKSLLRSDELVVDGAKSGGLVVIGSYTKKTTVQLENLLLEHKPASVEVVVERIPDAADDYLEDLKHACNQRIEAGQHIVIYTSRKLLELKGDNLEVNNSVSAFLTNLVEGISTMPRFCIVKGGITSNDIATRAFNIRRAVVAGQALPGVPVWISGEGSRFPGMPYIIFPGNVGSETDLSDLFGKLAEAGQR